MDRFFQACKDFGLTTSLKKANVLGQDTMELPAITIDDYELDVVKQCTCLGSTITNNLSSDTEIDKRIGKAATTLACLNFTSVDQPQTDSEDQDGSVQCLCCQHICQTGEKTQFLPSQKHPPYPCHILARQSVQHREPTFQTCSPCSDSAGCVGWGMSTSWRMAASQKTFSMESWHLEGDPKAAHSCATRMSARET